MSDPSKMPFDPIPVGPSPASMGLGEAPRPSFSRSVQEIPTSGLLPPSRKPIASASLPLGIAPELQNPLAGSTPPPKASGGLLWDLFRPTRSKGAIFAAAVSLAAGAYGLNLIAPTSTPTARQPLAETPPTPPNNGPKVEIDGIAPPFIKYESSLTTAGHLEPITLPPLNPKSLEVIPLPPSGGFVPVNTAESMPIPKPGFGGFNEKSTESVPLPAVNFGPAPGPEQVPLPKVNLEPTPIAKPTPMGYPEEKPRIVGLPPAPEEKPRFVGLPPVPEEKPINGGLPPLAKSEGAPLPIPSFTEVKAELPKPELNIAPIPATTPAFRDAEPVGLPALDAIPKTTPKIATIGDVTPYTPPPIPAPATTVPTAPIPKPNLTISPSELTPVGFSTPKTDFECDVVKVKKNESYVAISEKFYQTRKYAAALKAFNQNADINQMTEVYVPPMHEIRKYATSRDAEPEARPSVRGPVLENPVEPSDSVEWGAAGKKRATVRYEKYTTPREGMTAREVAKAVYDDEREWPKLTGSRGAKLKADEALPRGTEITVPREELPWK